MLYQETVEARTLDLIKRLMADEKLKNFRLAMELPFLFASVTAFQ